jgi:hypothetical protein
MLVVAASLHKSSPRWLSMDVSRPQAKSSDQRQPQIKLALSQTSVATKLTGSQNSWAMSVGNHRVHVSRSAHGISHWLGSHKWTSSLICPQAHYLPLWTSKINPVRHIRRCRSAALLKKRNATSLIVVAQVIWKVFQSWPALLSLLPWRPYKHQTSSNAGP